MPGPAAGYSGTPLARKLGFDPARRSAVAGCPVPYAELLAVAAAPVVLGPDDPLPAGTGFFHLFTTSRAELERRLAEARRTIDPSGVIWVSWPKKSAKIPTDITEDTIREVCLPMGLVDVKVCAVTEVWSGLKLVVRKDLR